MQVDITAVLLIIFTGIFGFIVKIVFDWLKNGRNGKGILPKPEEFYEIKQNIKWLREMHENRDNMGIPLWYYPKERHDEIMNKFDKLNDKTDKIYDKLDCD